jgi:sulfur carrier protein
MEGRTTSQGTAFPATLFSYHDGLHRAAPRSTSCHDTRNGREDRMIVNGTQEEVATPISVADLIATKGFDANRVAVELNGAIVPRTQRAQTTLKGTDTLEIVTFVQGG